MDGLPFTPALFSLSQRNRPHHRNCVILFNSCSRKAAKFFIVEIYFMISIKSGVGAFFRFKCGMNNRPRNARKLVHKSAYQKNGIIPEKKVEFIKKHVI
jgi:hypothetical protein